MAIDWTTLTAAKTTLGSVANWLNRSDLPTDNILLEAEAWLYQYLRVREMLTAAPFTFDSAASTEALPSGFLDPLHFVPYEWGDALRYEGQETFKPPRDENGALFASSTPACWSILGETAYIDVLLDANFVGILTYYATPSALSVSNTTNFLTRRYPRLLRRSCMAIGFEHMKDTSRAQEYYGLAMADIMEANKTNEMHRRGQSIAA